MSRFTIRRGLVPSLLAVAVLGAPACTSVRPIADGRPYPREVPRRPSLDIQVFRRASVIELTNTTARPLGASVVWLNARYAHPIAGLGIGEHAALPLRGFTDEYGESFRAGGFFATEAPDRLALAEVETVDAEGKAVMVGLVVVGGEPP